MVDKLRLEVLMVAMDRVTAPLKRVLGGASSTARGLKDLRDKLKALNDQQAAAAGVQKQSAEYARLNNQLKIHMAVLDGMRQSGTATAASIKREESAVRKLREALEQQRVSAGKARMALNAMGVGGNLGTAQERLRADIEQTNAALDRQRQRMAKLNAAQRSAGQMAARGAGMAAAGTGALYGGVRAGHAAMGVMGQARHAATEELRINALGLGEQESSKAIQFAKDFKSYGTSRLDNLELMRDAITVFNDRHHAEEAMPILAKMKFANEAAFGTEQGEDNSRKFMDMMKVIEMRGGANNREDFERNANMVQQVITATGGRVGAADWMHVIQRGKLAAKGFDEKEFFYRLEPLVQEMGGDAVGTGLTAAYQNLYQGRTTKRAAQNLERLGLIGDYSKVKHDKVGQTAQLNPGALKGADVFRRSQFEWMEKILIPALRAKGIESEQETIDAIGSIFSNTNAGALMATMYQQRAMVQKGYELNSKAANITELHSMAQGTPQGKEIDLRKRRDDLYAGISDAALPGYVKLLEVLEELTRAMGDFAREHPTLTKVLAYSTVGVALLAAGIGALAIPLGLILLKGAALRLMLARMGVQLGTSGAAGAGAAGRVGILTRAVQWLIASWAKLRSLGVGGIFNAMATAMSSPAKWLGVLRTGFGGVWRLLTAFARANPIAALVLGMVGLFAGLYTHWDKITEYFNAGEWLKMFAEIWAALEWGFNAATLGLYELLKTVVMKALSAVWDGIKSFVDYGKSVAESGRAPTVAEAVAAGGVATSPMAQALHTGQVNLLRPGEPIAQLAPIVPIAPVANKAAAPSISTTNQVTIQATPGMDAQAVARAVTAALERRDREAASRRYSRMDDID